MVGDEIKTVTLQVKVTFIKLNISSLRFGTQLVKRDIRVLVLHTLEVQRPAYWCMISRVPAALKV